MITSYPPSKLEDKDYQEKKKKKSLGIGKQKKKRKEDGISGFHTGQEVN